jgi:arabinan endo-1,5-alpha-L-arabinosidase
VGAAALVGACAGSNEVTTASSASSTPPATAVATPAPEVVELEDGTVVVPVEGDVTPVHDPVIVREGDTWHLFNTGTWLDHRTSDDLVTWHLEGSVFDDLPAWAAEESLEPAPTNLWAPDVSWWGGAWHLYYSASVWVPGQMPTRNSVIAHASSPTLDRDDPEFGWIDHGPVVRSRGEFADTDRSGWNAIDAHVVLDDEQQPWLVWGSGFDGLFLQPLRDDGSLDETVEPVNLARREPHPVLVIEAPTIVRHGDWWYLFASYDLCCSGTRSNYNVRVGRSAELTGPYVDREGRLLTEGGGSRVLAGHGDVFGPGHQAVFQAGSTLWLTHHWYDGENDGVPTLAIRPLDWDEDGWPVARGWTEAVTMPEPMGGRP